LLHHDLFAQLKLKKHNRVKIRGFTVKKGFITLAQVLPGDFSNGQNQIDPIPGNGGSEEKMVPML
jgi:hypothetical protein